MEENLKHYTPDEDDFEKFERINNMTEEQWEKRCILTNDCSICDMAIHQQLYTTTKHTCVYGMKKEQFEAAMDCADRYF